MLLHFYPYNSDGKYSCLMYVCLHEFDLVQGPHWHGRSGVHTHMTNTRITDPEILERRSVSDHNVMDPPPLSPINPGSRPSLFNYMGTCIASVWIIRGLLSFRDLDFLAGTYPVILVQFHLNKNRGWLGGGRWNNYSVLIIGGVIDFYDV